MEMSNYNVYYLELQGKIKTLKIFFQSIPMDRYFCNMISQHWIFFNRENDYFKRMRTNILNFVAKKNNKDFFTYFLNQSEMVFD